MMTAANNLAQHSFHVFIFVYILFFSIFPLAMLASESELQIFTFLLISQYANMLNYDSSRKAGGR